MLHPTVLRGHDAYISYLNVICCLFYAVTIKAIPKPMDINAKIDKIFYT